MKSVISSRKTFAQRLCAAFLAADWTPEGLFDASIALLGHRREATQRDLAAEVFEASGTVYAPAPRRLTVILRQARSFEELFSACNDKIAKAPPLPMPARMTPLATFAELPLPQLATAGDLARWLDLSPRRLDWFADIAGRNTEAQTEALNHYCWHWLPRRNGLPRLIEAPKPTLKRLQRRILREILDLVPCHPAAEGFRKGRSCHNHAQRHAGEDLVIAADLRDFFLRVPLARVHGLFRSLGYPWDVARLLTGICSSNLPQDAFDDLAKAQLPTWRNRGRQLAPHLPQGAPTSPSLANLCCWRLDLRLAGLARSFDANYSRYADDLAFSGGADLTQAVAPYLRCLAKIVREEGHGLNHAKTRVMGRGGRQRLTGLVVNDHINLPRETFDGLKATLFNCARFGPESQNRENHPAFRAQLDGRVTWVESVNPGRGAKLRRLFERIEWGSGQDRSGAAQFL